MNFLIMLNLKDEKDFNSNEIYIKGKLDDNDISWLPINRSLALQQKLLLNEKQSVDKDKMLGDIKNKVINLEKRVKEH